MIEINVRNCTKTFCSILIILLFIITASSIETKSITNLKTQNYSTLPKENSNEIGFVEIDNYDDDGGKAQGVAIKGDLALIANYDQGLEIVNISDKNNPKKISNYKTNGFAVDVVISNSKNVAYVALSGWGVAVINFDNPTNPYKMTSILPGGEVKGVDLYNNILHVSTYLNGIHFYEVSKPNEPLFISSWKGDFEIEGNAAQTKYGCLASSEGGLEIIDLTFPSTPFRVGRWNDSTGLALGVDTALIDQQKIAFLAYAHGGLIIINFTNPSSPHKIADYQWGTMRDVTIYGDLAFCCSYQFGLAILNISNPKNPVELSKYDTKGTVIDAAISGSLAIIADGEEGIILLRVTNPENPTLFSKFFDHGYATRLVIDHERELAFVVDGSAGLEIFDISNPNELTKIGFFDNNGLINAIDIYIEDDLAILAAFDYGIFFLDISDPTNPQLLNNYNDGNNVKRIIKNNDYLFVGSINETFLVLDISTINSITVAGTFVFPIEFPDVNALIIQDSILFVGTSNLGIYSLNITNVASITQIDLEIDFGTAYDFQIKDNYLFVADGNGGLEIYDISTTNFFRISRVATIGFSREIILFENLAFVAENSQGLTVYNISDPENPFDTGDFDSYSILGVKLHNEYLFTTAGNDGLFSLIMDSDGDSLPDFDERDIYGTDPYNSDTDGDEASDDFEIKYGFDPLDPSDGSEDADGDGLTNAHEDYVNSNPLLVDTDSDGLPDGYEVLVLETDPTNTDSDHDNIPDNEDDEDNDKLSNYDEYLIGTDPNDKDTDDDDYLDGLEVLYGTDPFDDKDNPYTRKIVRILVSLSIAVIILGGVIFITIREVRRRIKRNIEREQRLRDAEDDILIF